MLKYFGKSVKGKKSEENEDSFTLPEGNNVYNVVPDFEHKGHLFLVCDGIGGHNAGEVASSLCVNWFWQDYYNEDSEIGDLVEWIEKELISLNSRLFNLSVENAEYHGMGSTLVGLIIKDNQTYVFNIGDSRCYLLTGRDFKQLTEDDSEVWKLYKLGLIKKDEIITNRRKNLITQAIAIKTTMEYHIYEPIKLTEKQSFLLCSDGVHDVLVDTIIKKIMIKKMSIKEKCSKLIRESLLKKSKDDITVIIIESEK